MLLSHVGMALEPIGQGVGHRGSIGVSVSFPLRITRDSADVCATPPQLLTSLVFSLGSCAARGSSVRAPRSGLFTPRLIDAFIQLYVFRTLRAFASIPHWVFQLTLHSLWQVRHSHLEARAFESGSWLMSVAAAETAESGRTRAAPGVGGAQPVFASGPVMYF
jgi:hypothetical protein